VIVRGLRRQADLDRIGRAFAGKRPAAEVLLARLDAAIDRWGKMRAVERRAFVLTLNDAVRTRVAETGLRLFGRVRLPRGSYQVRVVASQPGGATGAAMTAVEVPDYTDLPLSISDVVVSSALGRSLLTLEEDPVLRRTLPAQPAWGPNHAGAWLQSMRQSAWHFRVRDRLWPLRFRARLGERRANRLPTTARCCRQRRLRRAS